ncbi:MBL fold metallo-hydrolase [Bacteroides sp. 224]|uniref:MBL fold metallo-hydrolase n=1 Tax=Bacteroides sp. 224 TaxID=2302936 RepID=UPI0013D4E97D|nr:MBL fold metallo-hydrolase [Bacteroides sp. 224]NDV65147.1 MBL fold metallo-hydrolase [Bacteroides sp. 224]
MKITIHRGINQIGGCITEVATENTRIFIDLGQNLPDNEGVSNDELASEESIKNLTKDLDAIFYTHYHGDHLDLFHFVPNIIPQYIGQVAKQVVIEKYKRLSFIQNDKERFESYRDQVENMISLREGKSVQVKDIKVTPYFVSHSAYESFMFLIEAENKRILHTGDFRDHGYLGNGLRKILNKIVIEGAVDMLIIEGTMLSRQGERVKTENELQKDVISIMNQYKNVFVLCSSTDMERLATFYAANKKVHNRPFVCDNYQKNILKIFSKSAGTKTPLFRFDSVYDFRENNKKLHDWMQDKGFCMLVRPTEKFSKYYNSLREQLKDEDTVLIYSMWGMYIQAKSKYAKENYLRFVNQFPNIEKLHTSGHASVECLSDVCKIVNPTKGIVPIHGEDKNDYYSLDIPEALKERIVTSSIINL